jgi:hypothetical protein
MPPIRAEMRAAVLGSAFLNCQPTPRYQEILGKKTPTAPIIIKRIGINVNMSMLINLLYNGILESFSDKITVDINLKCEPILSQNFHWFSSHHVYIPNRLSLYIYRSITRSNDDLHREYRLSLVSHEATLEVA